jgi:hypothetical protein
MLTSKLHVKPGMRVALLNTPPGLDRTIGKLPAGVTRAASLKALEGALDLVLLFVGRRR